jgi:hypothetical protein
MPPADRQAERAVISCLMHCGPCMMVVGEIGVQRRDFYFDAESRLFDLVMYLRYGGTGGPFDCWVEIKLRAGRGEPTPYLGLAWRQCAEFLAEVYTADLWLRDMTFWADPRDPRDDYYLWACEAAAKKVVDLSARRRTIHAAREALRDAMNPTGPADELLKRSGVHLPGLYDE